MAFEILTRCGYRCDLCLAYAENIKTNDQRALLCEGWRKIFGIDLLPEEIYCEGCLTCSANPIMVDKGCPVRPCVIAKEISKFFWGLSTKLRNEYYVYIAIKKKGESATHPSFLIALSA